MMYRHRHCLSATRLYILFRALLWAASSTRRAVWQRWRILAWKRIRMLIATNMTSHICNVNSPLYNEVTKGWCMLRAAGIHGDIDQAGRMGALADFRAARVHVLVATDVASRGLDIKSIKTVVSLDAPRDIDTHVHRIGRTGRAGDRDGVAYTLVTPAQGKFAGVPLLTAGYRLLQCGAGESFAGEC